jgi:hypothetical protein
MFPAERREGARPETITWWFQGEMLLMMRWLRVLLIVMVAIPIIGLLVAIVGLAVARLSLPASACTVSEASISTLELEKMTGSDVAARLGCDGVHKVELDSEGLRMETVSWRGDAWPYSLFEAQLINGVLHGTKTVRLDLNVTLPGEQKEAKAVPLQIPAHSSGSGRLVAE